MQFRLIERVLLTEDITAVRNQYPDIPEVDFNAIVKCDPTYTGNDSVGKFTKWILNQYKKGNVKVHNIKNYRGQEFTGYSSTVYYQGEYGPSIIKDLLNDYLDAMKNREINKDINSFKTPQDLKKTINEAPAKQLSKRQKERRLRKSMEGADLVYSDDDWDIFVPRTYEASCTLGAGSGWCTADTRTDDFFHKYLDENGGQYYILISRFEPEEKYQFHFESDQFMGSGTNPGHTVNQEYEIDYDQFIEKYPKVGEFFESQGYDENFQPNVYDPHQGVVNYFEAEGQYDENGDYVFADYSIRDMMELVDTFGNQPRIGGAKGNESRISILDILYVAHCRDYFDNASDFDDVYLKDVHESNYSYDLWNNLIRLTNKELNKNVLKYIDEGIPDKQQEIMYRAMNEFLNNSDVQDGILEKFFSKVSGVKYEWDDVRLYATAQEVASYFDDDYVYYQDNYDEGPSTDGFMEYMDMYASDEAFSDDEIPDDFDARQAIVAKIDKDYLERQLTQQVNMYYPTVITLALLLTNNSQQMFDSFVNELTLATYDVLGEVEVEDAPDYMQKAQEQPQKTEQEVDDDIDGIPF